MSKTESKRTESQPPAPSGAVAGHEAREVDRLARIFGPTVRVKSSPLSCPILKTEALTGGRYLRLLRLESAKLGEDDKQVRILIVEDLENAGATFQLAETYSLGAALDRGTLALGDSFRLELIGTARTAGGRTVNEYKFDKLEVEG